MVTYAEVAPTPGWYQSLSHVPLDENPTFCFPFPEVFPHEVTKWLMPNSVLSAQQVPACYL